MKKLLLFTLVILLTTGGCACLDQSGSGSRQAGADLVILLEKQAVQEVITQLFVSTDNRDWEMVNAIFADQVLFDMTSLAGGEPVTLSPVQITQSWDKGLKPLEAIHHQAGNFLITVENDSATAFCYGIATHYLPNKTNQNTRTFVGSYDFHLVKVDGSWKIDQFKFNMKYLDGNLQLESS
ncbi:MAG: nuclear transport factor 2 family protein [Desulfobulbaceae bacterium]|nr:MAG: nuclear transport factor 2 family protein [Desulfobulbaceae bacterium]